MRAASAMRLRPQTRRAARAGWSRAAGNPILSSSQAYEPQSTVQEPSLIYESGTWKMWYTGGYTAPRMCYATCSGDPTVAGNWTKYASNPILGQGTVVAGWVSGCNVVKVSSTYYAYYYDATGGGNLKVSTSSDGTTWGTPSTAIASNAVAWMTGWANSYVWNEGGTTWKMLVEGKSTSAGTPWRIAYATSTNGTTWSVQGSGPVSGLTISGGNQSGGPWLANGGATINGRYQLFFHGGDGSFTDIYHAYSTDAQTWTITGGTELAANRGTYEVQQAADPSIVELNGTSYLFYSGVDNGTPKGYINVATYPSTITDLVLWEN